MFKDRSRASRRPSGPRWGDALPTSWSATGGVVRRHLWRVTSSSGSGGAATPARVMTARVAATISAKSSRRPDRAWCARYRPMCAAGVRMVESLASVAGAEWQLSSTSAKKVQERSVDGTGLTWRWATPEGSRAWAADVAIGEESARSTRCSQGRDFFGRRVEAVIRSPPDGASNCGAGGPHRDRGRHVLPISRWAAVK